MVTTPAKSERSTERPEPSLLLSASVRVKLPEGWDTTDEALMRLSSLNDSWLFELTAEGELVIMSPEGFGSSRVGMDIAIQIGAWSNAGGGGVMFGAQLGVRLADSSVLSPDTAWISDELFGERDVSEGYLRDCPELIVEVVSRTDSLVEQQEKMQLWIKNGAQLGWLVDPSREIVVVYRPNTEPEQLDKPGRLGGEDVCAGLEVDLERIWK